MEKIVTVLEDESTQPLRSMKGVSMGLNISVRVGSEQARYDVYLTDKRIIAAVVFSTSDLSKIYEIAAWQGARNFKKIREQRRQELKGKTPDEILHAHPESFEVPYEKIQSIKLKKGLLSANLEIEAPWEGEVRKFNVPVPKSKIDEVKKFLDLYLAGKVIK
jgi:hypothetical protein